MTEQEIREQIAQEIESLDWKYGFADAIQEIVMPQVRDRCAAIARGQQSTPSLTDAKEL